MSEKKSCDLAVIGAGTGGYVAAIKAAQLGLKVVIIEKGDLGGVCLNVGCIPTKTMISATQILSRIKDAEEFGITVGKPTINYAKMKERKDAVVKKLRAGVGTLMKTNNIEVLQGEAKFTSPRELKVMGKDNVFLHAEKTIIATGSIPLDVKAFPCDNQRILNSTSALELTTAPKSIIIIGGGYIGCEFASFFRGIGAEVTVLEALDSLIPLLGSNLAQPLTSAYQKQGIHIRTKVFVEGIENNGKHVTVKLKGGEKLEAEYALVAIGRKIVSENLALEKAGVSVDQKGAVLVNDRMETSANGIYAIGDVTGILMLAHVASHQGIVAATNAAGGDAEMHYDSVPAVVFTNPEIALVGLTLEQAQKIGYAAALSVFPFTALGKAVAAHEEEGFAQIVSDKKTGQILGAQVIGYEASALISEMGLAIHNELTLESVIDTIHAHPTLPEAWHEAALIANNTPINFPPKKK